jgi:hypothetical protein
MQEAVNRVPRLDTASDPLHALVDMPLHYRFER